MAFCVLGFSATAWAQLPAVQHHGQIEYVTGGFGLEESDALKAAMENYSLALTFASSDGSRTAYVAKVQVVIRNRQDITVFNAQSEGPFLLARLPAGQYQLFATYQNETLSRPISVPARGSARHTLVWPRKSEPAPVPSGRSFAPGSIPGLD